MHSLNYFTNDLSYVFGSKLTLEIDEFWCIAGLNFLPVSGLVNLDVFTNPQTSGEFGYGPFLNHFNPLSQ